MLPIGATTEVHLMCIYSSISIIILNNENQTIQDFICNRGAKWPTTTGVLIFRKPSVNFNWWCRIPLTPDCLTQP